VGEVLVLPTLLLVLASDGAMSKISVAPAANHGTDNPNWSTPPNTAADARGKWDLVRSGIRARSSQVWEAHNKLRSLPPGKSSHYFMSHKKQHSLHASVPEQVAKNFHDCLELNGFIGWFDIDNLKKITKEDIHAAIKETCAMIVCLHDETVQSEWCQFEWQCAKEEGVPILCVIDMQRCSKENILAGLHQMQTDYEASYLLTYQCVEFTERNRKTCVGEMTAFIQEQSDGLLAAVERKDSCSSERLLVGDSEQVLLHWFADRILFYCGTPYIWDGLKQWEKWWVWFSLGSRYFCVFICTCRAVVMRSGPAVYGFSWDYSEIALHVMLIVNGLICQNLLRSRDFHSLLKNLRGESSLAQAKQIHDRSFKLFQAAMVGAVVIVGLAYYVLVTGYYNSTYLFKSDATIAWTIFIWSHNIFWFMALPPIGSIAFLVYVLVYVCIRTSIIPLFESFEVLDRQISNHGLVSASVEGGVIIRPDHRDLQRFQQEWIAALRQYRKVEKLLLTTFVLTLFFGLTVIVAWISETKKISALFHSRNLSVFSTEFVQFGVCVVMGVLFPALEVAVVFACTSQIRVLKRAQRSLVFENPSAKMFVDHVVNCEDSLDCHGFTLRELLCLVAPFVLSPVLLVVLWDSSGTTPNHIGL